MNFAIAQLALLFLPGLIWATIDIKFGVGSKPSQFDIVIRSFMFGIATYVCLFLFYSIFECEFVGDGIDFDNENINLVTLADEIGWSIPLSMLLSVIWLYTIRYRIVMKTLHYIGATKRFGSEDVWAFTFNSNQKHVEYIDIRDVENGFIFSGYVNAWSENEDLREILLTDVIIYDESGEEISRAPHVYLSRKKDNIWIEFPYDEHVDQNDVNKQP